MSINKTALDEARVRFGFYNFEMADIPPGSVLTLVEDETITCEVVDQNRVAFQGKTISNSAAAYIAITDLGYPWKTASGPMHWKFEDETLNARRQRMEEGD